MLGSSVVLVFCRTAAAHNKSCFYHYNFLTLLVGENVSDFFFFCSFCVRASFKYNVRLPWYARLALGKSIVWHDVLEADPTAKVREQGVYFFSRHSRSRCDIRTVSCSRLVKGLQNRSVPPILLPHIHASIRPPSVFHETRL